MDNTQSGTSQPASRVALDLAPLIGAIRQALRSWASIQCTASEPSPKSESQPSFSGVMALLSFVLDGKSGWIGFFFPEQSLKAVLKAKLKPGQGDQESKKDLEPALEALINVVGGIARQGFEATKRKFNCGYPLIISGQQLNLTDLTPSPSLTIPMEIPGDKFYLEFNLESPMDQLKSLSGARFAPKTTIQDLTLLVIDDVLAERKIIMKFCAELGFSSFEEAESGAQGWDKIIHVKPPIGLVICDWHMPGMSGLELLRKIRESVKYAQLPVIMVTAESEKNVVVGALKAGVNGFLLKPVTRQALEQKLEELQGKMTPGNSTPD